jgi:hypothetical protein
MKSQKLQLFIRKIVREEVAMAINEVITELKQPSLSSDHPKKQVKKRMVEKKHYSSNSVLNDIMNETAKTSVLEESGNPLTKMNSVMQSSYGDMMNTSVDTEAAAGIGVDLNKVDSNAMDFMNRDYSAVLKKSYEKSGKR